jgi:hypothetical protein
MDADIRAWLDVLIRYAADWDNTFRTRSDYFTQEYWYLFTECTRAHLDGSPLGVSEAAAKMQMKASANAKMVRINKAVDDGYLRKERLPGEDGRKVVLVPTDLLIGKLTEHFRRTLADAKKSIDGGANK